VRQRCATSSWRTQTCLRYGRGPPRSNGPHRSGRALSSTTAATRRWTLLRPVDNSCSPLPGAVSVLPPVFPANAPPGHLGGSHVGAAPARPGPRIVTCLCGCQRAERALTSEGRCSVHLPPQPVDNGVDTRRVNQHKPG
jgi:hypothetical protein